jgi:hypothetical protein
MQAGILIAGFLIGTFCQRKGQFGSHLLQKPGKFGQRQYANLACVTSA